MLFCIIVKFWGQVIKFPSKVPGILGQLEGRKFLLPVWVRRRLSDRERQFEAQRNDDH